MFIQLHTLTSYPAALLNRDDAGFAKQMPFGGDTRTRISSQCLKYHWRNHDGKHSLRNVDGIEESIRSREIFTRRIVDPLIEDGFPPSLVYGTVLAISELVLTGDTPTKTDLKSALTATTDEEVEELLHTNQVVVLGRPEVRYLREIAEQVVSDVEGEYEDVFEENEGLYSDLEGWFEDNDDAFPAAGIADSIRSHSVLSGSKMRENLRAIDRATGLSAALYGRMATSDVLAQGHSAIHVQHALTTHPQEAESDYFSAVDELRRDDPSTSGTGSAHINTQDLTSGLYYMYVTIDVPQLVSNLEGAPRSNWRSVDHGLATEVIRRFPHLMATVSPGAKKGATAPYAYAHALIAEVGEDQPRTLANAFQSAVPRDAILQRSYQQLADYVRQVDGMYSAPDRRVAAIDAPDQFLDAIGDPDPTDIQGVSEWLVGYLGDGK